jgi:hypothetical protein
MRHFRAGWLALALSVSVVSFGVYDLATAEQKATQQHAYQHQEKMGASTGMKGGSLTASLVDAENKAKQKTATIEVKVSGVQLVDPAKSKEHPQKGQAHLHYQLDDGPVIATTAPKLSFHELKPGPHKIVVMLAANDHSPLGPQQTLDVTIP